jgi:hypothetical protein
MRRLASVVALGLALMAVPGAYADRDKDKDKKKFKKQEATSVAEPTSFALLAAGLLLCGGVAVVLGRKRLAQN